MYAGGYNEVLPVSSKIICICAGRQGGREGGKEERTKTKAEVSKQSISGTLTESE